MAKDKDKLADYRRKRSFSSTPEPTGEPGAGEDSGRFVIQEHHARRLHWDLRLEHEGVLVSWALPRGVPSDPDQNRLAVHTEDHPLEYIDFHGEIPAGEYGAGTMEIWDAGTYEAEKFEASKVVVRFDGEKVRGRYALFQTRGNDWMIHRMDPAEEGWEPLPERLEPMLAARGKLPQEEDGWAYEIRWRGARALAFCEPGHLRIAGGGEPDVTSRFPEVRAVLEELHGRPALFDGVLVTFGEDGRPDPERLRRRTEAGSDSQIRRLRGSTPASYVAFDLLHHDGRSLLDQPYEARRAELEALALESEAWQVPAFHRGDGEALLAVSSERGLPGIVAKRLESPYTPGKRKRDWLEIRAARASRAGARGPRR
jgi:bifunctional non-homologous end joining protein LigD